jgi:energy-coupling factor transport system permease protein
MKRKIAMNNKTAPMEEFSLKKDNSLRNTNPLIKFLFVIMISLFLLAVEDLWKVFVVVVTLISFYVFFPLPYEISRPRFKMITTFSLTIFLVQIFFNQNGDLLFYLLPIEIGENGPFIPIHQTGLYQGLLLMGRFWGLLSVSWIFVNSTNPFDFAHSLTKIKVPYRIAFSLSLALRFAPVFSNETKIIQNAQQARGLNLKATNVKGIINILKFTLIPLIGSTLNRILGLTISMEGRGFGSYKTRNYFKDIPFTMLDLAKLLSFIIFIVVFLSF